MKTDSISSVTFNSKAGKQRFITENMRSSIESLLLRMNAETAIEKQGDYFISTITNKLKHSKGFVFEDERRYKKKMPSCEQMKGFSVLEFGRTRFDIDNKNGEIIDYQKPFYKPWFFVKKKAEKVLNEFRAYFDDRDIVQKECLKLNDLTPEGEKKIKKMVLEYEKKRLEEVTNKLEKEIENESR